MSELIDHVGIGQDTPCAEWDGEGGGKSDPYIQSGGPVVGSSVTCKKFSDLCMRSVATMGVI